MDSSIVDHQIWNTTDLNFEAVVVMTSDYYPFGMQMPGRHEQYGPDGEYRYAYNGMEVDNEVSGNGNSYTTEFRQYDPRLGRWKSLDPLAHQASDWSPYRAFFDNPIVYTDPSGLFEKWSEARAYKKANNTGGVIKKDGNGGWFIRNRYKATAIAKGEQWEIDAGLTDKNGIVVSALAMGEKRQLDLTNTGVVDYASLDSELKHNLQQFAFGHPESTIEFPFLDSYVRGDGVGTYGATPSGSRVGNLFTEFLNGTGPEYSIFIGDHPLTVKVRQDIKEVDRLRKAIFDKFDGDLERIEKEAAERDGAIFTGFSGYGGDFRPTDEDVSSIAQFIGSFSADVFYDASTKKITIHVIDSKSRSSLYYHLAEDIERKEGERTPMGNTYQKYIWSEPVENYLKP